MSVIDLLNKKILNGSIEVSCVHNQNRIFILSRTFSVFGIPNVICLETIEQGKMGLSSPTEQVLSLLPHFILHSHSNETSIISDSQNLKRFRTERMSYLGPHS